MAEDAVVVVFARAPVPGETKTRLIPTLGALGAAELYRCFLLDVLARAAEVAAGVVVAASEAAQADAVRELVREACPRAEVILQRGDDLGERMMNAFQEAFTQGYRRVVILGTDLPTLPFDRVTRALDLLRDRELVLGPCLDGGYYLIGLRRARPQLFQHMEWGGSAVLVDTLRRAQSIGASVSLLEPWFDVDTPRDLEVLRSYLTALALAGESIPCAKTWRYLRHEAAAR
jgi:hypothetical protein